MFTVAVKRENTHVQFCGLWEDRKIADQSARGLRQSWINAAMPGPSSIRVREVEEGEFWKNQRVHGYNGKTGRRKGEPKNAG